METWSWNCLRAPWIIEGVLDIGEGVSVQAAFAGRLERRESVNTSSLI